MGRISSLFEPAIPLGRTQIRPGHGLPLSLDVTRSHNMLLCHEKTEVTDLADYLPGKLNPDFSTDFFYDAEKEWLEDYFYLIGRT